MHDHYDYIIIGGGSAGCIVAGRLSEDPSIKILLIEAGPVVVNENRVLQPARFGELIGSELDWGMEGFPKGRMLGGSSAMNACVYMRGSPDDYNDWPAGWRYEDLLPYFKKAEDCSFIPAAYLHSSRANRGFNGPVKLSVAGNNGQHICETTKAFLVSCQELGYDYMPDINNRPTQKGVSLHQYNIHKGARQSMNVAYLHNRPNLTVLTHTQVNRLLIKGRKVVHIETVDGREFSAGKEVILAAGAINSPVILMKSGIGPENNLRKMGLSTLIDLPVGQGLQDHMMSPVVFKTDELWAFDAGNFSDPGIQASLFARSGPEAKKNDIQITILAGITKQISQFIRKTSGGAKMNFPESGFVIFPVIGLPRYRGHVSLSGNLKNSRPHIHYRGFTDEIDTEVMVASVRIIRDMVKQPALCALGAKEIINPHIPHPPESDAYIHSYIRNASSQGHMSCTCAIGKVVNEQLLVYGLENLRVVDSSIMPSMINVNVHNTVIAMAEKACDLIGTLRA